MTVNTSLWSDEARSRRKHAVRHYDIENEADARAMRVGPQLAEDGYTVTIPGGREFYNKAAARFWRVQGFEWDPDCYQWSRDIRTALNGKQFTASAWLRSARRKFYEFYPELEDTND